MPRTRRTTSDEDSVVAELHRVRRAMFAESNGDIRRYVELIRQHGRRRPGRKRRKNAS
jgi:hypothetical protein